MLIRNEWRQPLKAFRNLSWEIIRAKQRDENEKEAENIFAQWNFRFSLTMKLLLSFWMLNPFSAVLWLASKFISRATLSSRKQPLSCYYFSSIFSIPFFNPSIIFHLNFMPTKGFISTTIFIEIEILPRKLFAALPLHSNKVIYLKMPVVCARYAKCGTFGFLNVYYWIFCSPFSNHFSPWQYKHKNFKHEIKKSS